MTAENGLARWRILALVAAAEILGMSAWFSASAIGPRLAEAGGWRWAFVVLALGPACGIAAIRRLVRLRTRPADPVQSAGSEGA